jgi:hypothetical protein
MDGIGRHLGAQQQVLQRQIISERQNLIQRAAQLEHDKDDKIAGLAEANASVAQERARLDGVAPGSDDEADVLDAARSQILRMAIEQRIANAKGPQAITLYHRMSDALTPADRRALEVPIATTRDDTATHAWLARESATDGPPLADRVASDDGLTDLQRLILQAKIGARESAAESHRVTIVKGLDDQLAAATKAIRDTAVAVPGRHAQRAGPGLRRRRRTRQSQRHAPTRGRRTAPPALRAIQRRDPAAPA